MAVINAFYNTPKRMEQLSCGIPFERVCTCGMDVSGKTVGFIGHLRMPEETVKGAKRFTSSNVSRSRATCPTPPVNTFCPNVT